MANFGNVTVIKHNISYKNSYIHSSVAHMGFAEIKNAFETIYNKISIILRNSILHEKAET